MITNEQDYRVKDLSYTIRPAKGADAAFLSALRLKIDGETENMDREEGEAFIDEAGFRELIRKDSQHPRNLFLIAETGGEIVGFSRCEGTDLKRSSHKVEFGVCVTKDYWGYGIGRNLLKQSVSWADSNGIKKICLNVLETNDKAIALYQTYGFEKEGILKADKLLSDGKFYNTIMMGRCHNL